jgi:hypothetical protein
MKAESFVALPAAVFRGAEDFKRFRNENRDLLDERYRREQALGVSAVEMVMEGLCAPCLRVARFSSRTHGGEETADGRWVPHWRLEQGCDCTFNLSSHERALAHSALPRFGQQAWYRVALLGRNDSLAGYLAQFQPSLVLYPRVEREVDGTLFLPVKPASLHMVIAADELCHLPELDAALAAVAGALMPGGIFLFCTPFDVEADKTMTDLTGLPVVREKLPTFSSRPVHRLGWDLIDHLRAAGFDDASAHLYWSEELGYLGPYNMIFSAFR